MANWNEYSWQGSPADIASALSALRGLNIDPTILGPTIDEQGVAYIRVRTAEALLMPAGLSVTDDVTAERQCGIWLGDSPTT